EHAVAEKLRHELDVGRLAAAGACAAELEERLHELDVFDLGGREDGAIGLGDLEEEIPVGGFTLPDGWLRDHVDRLVLHFALALGGTDLDAEGAAGAIFGGDLQGVLAILHVLPAGGCGLEGGRHGRGRVAVEDAGVVDFGADYSVRADEDALAALDAELLV